jgi:hypothetical protein
MAAREMGGLSRRSSARPTGRSSCSPPRLAGQGTLAASHHDRDEEQLVLVDEPSLDRLGREPRTAHAEISAGLRLQLPDASGSNSRSIRVLALVTVCSVLE